MGRLINRLRASAIDLAALRVSEFRRVFLAQTLSGIGSQVTVVTMMYQVQRLTGSTLDVGYIGLAQIAPTVGFGLVGGAIADAMSRKKLLVWTQLGLICSSVALVLLATGHPPLWAIYLLAALGAGMSSIGNSTRSAITPMTVPKEVLDSAIQLREVMTQAGRVLGPIVGGALIASLGISWAYGVDTVGFIWALTMYSGLPDYIPEVRRRFELSSIVEGFRYIGTRASLASIFVADLIAMVFGMPRAVFPALAEHTFHVGAFGYGVLAASPPIGAAIGLVFVGLSARIVRQGFAVLLMVALWGLAIALAGIAPWFWLAIVLFAVAGGADMFSAIFRQTILLKTTPNELLGRLSSVHIMVVTGGPPIGDFEAGAAADLVGLRPSVVLGGAICVAGIAAWGAAVPSFARWRLPPTSEHLPLEPSEETPI